MGRLCFSSFAVQQAWLTKYTSGPGSTNPPVGVGLDTDGNIYLAGSSTRSSPPYDLDYVVIKYSPSGTQLWANRFGSPGLDETVRAFVVDTDGGVLVTGTTNTIKYHSSGLLAWTAPYPGRDVAADANGNCYVTGFSVSDFSTVKLDPQGSNVWARAWDYRGGQDISQVVAVDNTGSVFVGGLALYGCFRPPPCYWTLFAIKYDPNGVELWRNQIHDGYVSMFSEFGGFLSDKNGDLYIGIRGHGLPGPPFSWSTGKISATGEYLWFKNLSTAFHNEGMASMILNQSANVYYTGTDYQAYQSHKLTMNGTNIWAATYRPENSGVHRGFAIAPDAAGNAYVTGQSEGIGTGNDYATIKYSTNGQQLWVQRFTEPGNSDDQAHAIALGPNGEVYVTGFSNPTNGLYESLHHADQLDQHRHRHRGCQRPLHLRRHQRALVPAKVLSGPGRMIRACCPNTHQLTVSMEGRAMRVPFVNFGWVSGTRIARPSMETDLGNTPIRADP